MIGRARPGWLVVLWLAFGKFVLGAQFEAGARLVRKESAAGEAGASESLGEAADTGSLGWCRSEVQQQDEALETLIGTSSTWSARAGAQELLAAVQDLLRTLKLESQNATAFSFKEYNTLNTKDYLCTLPTTYTNSTNQQAVLAIPGILKRACSTVKINGTDYLSDANRQILRKITKEAAAAIACSELGLEPTTALAVSHANTDKHVNASSTKALLEIGEDAVDGMSETFLWLLEGEHRLDFLDSLVPGAREALEQEVGVSSASLLALDRAALESAMQRVAERLRTRHLTGVKIHPHNVRPHPFRPGGEGNWLRSSYANAVCPGTSASVLDGIFKTRNHFDQGCSSPAPLGYLNIMTPACYGHDLCCECGKRTSCDKPFGDAMVKECGRKIRSWLKRGACKVYGRVMAAATYLWGMIKGDNPNKPAHCSNKCVKDMMDYKKSMTYVDPYFK